MFLIANNCLYISTLINVCLLIYVTMKRKSERIKQCIHTTKLCFLKYGSWEGKMSLTAILWPKAHSSREILSR